MQTTFERFVSEIMIQYEAVGVAVSVFNREQTYYQNFWGFRNQARRLKIDENSIFGIASLTKSFTCLCIMQLASRGVIDINCPVSNYLPEYHGRQDYPVLVRHLMSHSAGYFPLRRMLLKDVAVDMGIWTEDQAELTYHKGIAVEGAHRVAQRLDSQDKYIGRPGEYMSYSNDGYGLLSEIVRRFGGEPSFGDYVRENILDPLGMTRSSCEYLAPLTDFNSNVLYRHKEGVLKGGFDFYDNAFVLPGGGAMKSTLRDMRTYVRMFMAGGIPILDAYSIREMIKPIQEFHFQNYYGYGISTKFLEDLNIHEHRGSLTGISSAFAWSPQLDVGAVVLCNTTGVPVISILNAAFRWFDGLAPIAESPWHDVVWDKNTRRQRCGIYHSGEGVIVEISGKDDGLSVIVDTNPVNFRIVSPDMLIVTAPMIDYDMIFLSDMQRGVWGIRFKDRIIPKTK